MDSGATFAHCAELPVCLCLFLSVCVLETSDCERQDSRTYAGVCVFLFLWQGAKLAGVEIIIFWMFVYVCAWNTSSTENRHTRKTGRCSYRSNQNNMKFECWWWTSNMFILNNATFLVQQFGQDVEHLFNDKFLCTFWVTLNLVDEFITFCVNSNKHIVLVISSKILYREKKTQTYYEDQTLYFNSQAYTDYYHIDIILYF